MNIRRTVTPTKPAQLFALTAHLVAVSGVIVFSGCDTKTPTYPAGGKVAYANGTPLAGGWVHFRSNNGDTPVTARGLTQPDGTFKLTTFKNEDGAVAGKHQALVTVTVRESDLSPPKIDPRFNDFSKSGLEFTVTENPEQNQFQIVVTPPTKK